MTKEKPLKNLSLKKLQAPPAELKCFGENNMNSEIKLRRFEAAKLADAINKIEGVPISDYARRLYAQWVSGEITGKEMKDALISTHRKCHESNV